MSKSKKTRFFAIIDGVERLLFSVQKSTKGSITITSRTPTNFESFRSSGKFGFSDIISEEFKEQHYSIHESHDGDATTITQKTQLSGQHISNVAFIPNTKDYLLWPVFWRRYPIFETDISQIVRKSRDTYIQIAEYSYKTATLLYGVFVARPSFDTSILTDNGLDFKKATFENHAVIVIPYFINFPSTYTGDVIGVATSSTVINKVEGPDHRQISTKSLKPEKLIEVNHHFMEKLQQIYFERMHQGFREIGMPPIPLPMELLELTQQPLQYKS